MLDLIRELQRQQRELDGRIRLLRSERVSANGIRTRARDFVDFWFRSARPAVRSAGLSDQDLAQLDSDMHVLLESSHARTSKAAYRRTLKSIANGCLTLEKVVLQGIPSPAAAPASNPDPLDVIIIGTLAALVPSAARSFEQAVIDLRQPSRLSWRGPATDLREALRETLDHLAPDKDVTGQQGFKLEKDTNGPTMKQKVRFILRSRGASKSSMESPEGAVQAVDEAVGSFVRSVYTRSSVSTHTPTDKREVLRVRDFVRVALTELLEIET